MSQAYPRKQTIFIFVICAIAICIVAVYVYGNSSNNDDTDRDGTNIKITNVSTSTEIITNYDWRQSFIDNALVKKDGFSTKNSTGTKVVSEPLTETEKLGRVILTQYAKLKQSGQSTNEEAIKQMADQILTQEVYAEDLAKVYTLKDIRISPNNTPSAIKEYGNKFGEIIRKYGPKRNDASIALEGIRNGTDDYVTELQSNVAHYQSILRLLALIPVPSTLSSAHVSFMNGISKTQFIANSLATTANDPIKSMVALNISKDAVSLIYNSLQTIKKALLESGAVYGPEEGGSYFHIN